MDPDPPSTRPVDRAILGAGGHDDELRPLPLEALWGVHVRTARSRGPIDAWRQLAIAYRALATLPRVEICDPERWYPASPQRFRDPRRYYDHAPRIIGYLAVATELLERGFLSPRGELRLDPM